METHLRISVFLDLFGLGLFFNSTYFLLFVSAVRWIDRFRNSLSDPITDFFFTSFTTLRLDCSGSCGTAFFLMLFTRHFWKMVYGRLVLRFAFNQTLNSDLCRVIQEKFSGDLASVRYIQSTLGWSADMVNPLDGFIQDRKKNLFLLMIDVLFPSKLWGESITVLMHSVKSTVHKFSYALKIVYIF